MHPGTHEIISMLLYKRCTVCGTKESNFLLLCSFLRHSSISERLGVVIQSITFPGTEVDLVVKKLFVAKSNPHL